MKRISNLRTHLQLIIAGIYSDHLTASMLKIPIQQKMLINGMIRKKETIMPRKKLLMHVKIIYRSISIVISIKYDHDLQISFN